LATWIERSRNSHRGSSPTSKLPTLAAVGLTDKSETRPLSRALGTKMPPKLQPNCQRTKRGATTTHFAITPTQTNWGHIP